MQGRKKSFPVFIGFFLLALLLFVLSQQGWLNGMTGVIQSITLPIQRSSFFLFHKDDENAITKLKNENRNLQTRLVNLQALEKDNQALRDQFALTHPAPEKLLPAFIVGMPSFIPGVSVVDSIIIDKGTIDKVRVGNSVVLKDNLIGKVVKTTPQMSVVDLLNHKNISFTAQTIKTSAFGISRGTGDDKIVLDNVLLSDKLQTGDIVVAKDPQLLVVGKIVSVNKKASALFQAAVVESLVDVLTLNLVFVLIN